MCGGIMPQMPKAIVAVECVCTTPLTSGHCASTPACQRHSFDGLPSPPSCSPVSFISITFSTAVSRKVTLVAVQSMRSVPGMRTLMLPPEPADSQRSCVRWQMSTRCFFKSRRSGVVIVGASRANELEAGQYNVRGDLVPQQIHGGPDTEVGVRSPAEVADQAHTRGVRELDHQHDVGRVAGEARPRGVMGGPEA